MLEKVLKRLRRKNRIRSKISGTSLRPRLSIYRSNTHIYAQIIDDITWKTLCSYSDMKIKKWTKTERAKEVWILLAQEAVKQNLKSIVFDKWGFAYHGRIKALADSARDNWLEF